MNLQNSAQRTITVNVSAGNLMAQLYTLGTVKDNETIKSLTIAPSVKGQALDGKAWKEDEVIPITIKLEEVN